MNMHGRVLTVLVAGLIWMVTWAAIMAVLVTRLLGVTDAVFSNLVILGALAAVVTVCLARATRRRLARAA